MIKKGIKYVLCGLLLAIVVLVLFILSIRPACDGMPLSVTKTRTMIAEIHKAVHFEPVCEVVS